MKLFISFLLLMLAASTSSFNTGRSTDINTKIENYFNSLDLTKKQESNDKVLNQLKNNIEFSDFDNRHTYLLTGNSTDALAFTQIIILTWLKEKKFKKVDLMSCSQTLTISEPGLQTLKEIGYEIEFKEGQYNVSFSDKDKPLKVAVYSCDDKKAKQEFVMKLLITAGSTESNDTSTLKYVGTDSKETFKTLATDLYSMIKVLKK